MKSTWISLKQSRMPSVMVYPDTSTDVDSHLGNVTTSYSTHENSNTTNRSSLQASEMFNFIVFIAVRGSISVVGFVANIICYKVLKADSGKKHRAATFLLQALAVADNLVLTCFFVTGINKGLPLMLAEGEEDIAKVLFVYTKVYLIPVLYMTRLTSVWMTVLIATNRYIAVCWPFDAPRLTSLKRTRIQVAVVAIVAVILCLPMFFKYSIEYPEDYDSMTVPSLKRTSIGPDTIFDRVYKTLVENIIAVVFPLIVLTVLNTRIIWELRKVAKSRDGIHQNGSGSENNITVVMVVIVIVFIVCNIPYQIYMVAWYTIDDSDGWYALYCASNVLLAANSATNFVVYYVLRQSFRQALRKALCCCQPQVVLQCTAF